MDKVNWIHDEFVNLNLGDKRLDERLKLTASCLYSFPLSPINKACGNWPKTKAAYNLFHNKKYDSEKVFSEHQKQTFARIHTHVKKGGVVVVPQDTTYFNYTNHPAINDLGRLTTIGNKKIVGFSMHSSLALTEDELPLGIIEQNIFVRKEIKGHKNRTHKNLPINEKESFRWVDHLQTLIGLQDDYEIVSVCDREGDIYEYIQMANDFGVGFVVRSNNDRMLIEGNKKISDHLKTLKAKGRFTIKVKSKAGKERDATFKIYFDKVQLQPPARTTRSESIKLDIQELSIVNVREINPEPGEERLEWILLTNKEVSNIEYAKRIIRFYKIRWNIECWHKVMKSGFKVEDCRLEKYKRLERYVGLISILAWKIFFLVKLKRTHPLSSCTYIFEDIEWQALYFKIHKTLKMPKFPPTVAEVLTWLGILGGFLNRKNDGDPGMTVLWRGMQRLSDAIDDYTIFCKELMGNS